MGEVVWKDRAKDRVISNAPLMASEASLGEDRRLTGTMKEEISYMSQRSSPPGTLSMISLRAGAVALPGIVLPKSRAMLDMLGRRHVLIRGGMKGRGVRMMGGGRNRVGRRGGREGLGDGMVVGVKRAPRGILLASSEMGGEALDPEGETAVVAWSVSGQRRSGEFMSS